MAKFLIRSFSDPKGYEEVNPPGGLLPRQTTDREEDRRSLSYTPWGMTGAGEVVYAKTGEHQSWRGGGDAKGGAVLKPYDSTVSQNRRRLAESELGLYALQQPELTRATVRPLSLAIRKFLLKNHWENTSKMRGLMFKEVGHYVYTNKGQGFGRISEEKKETVGESEVWNGIIETLVSGRLDQVMALHDAIGRKILDKYPSPQLTLYNSLGPLLRQRWFDDANRRGRVAAPGKAASTTTGGIVNAGQENAVGTVQQSRNRGVDMFQRDLKRRRDPDADAYYDDVDLYHLLFGAGISGTTGTLLQAGCAFNLSQLAGEQLKQYVLAIIGYLVGGGMHSYHETMAVAQKLGVPYKPGAYIPSLPLSFLNSHQFQSWSEKYYDVVYLGATHWRFNAGALPSHMNPNLTWVSPPPRPARG